MRRYDLTKNTFLPTYLSTYLPSLENSARRKLNEQTMCFKYEFHIINNISMSNSDAFIHHTCSIICQPEDLLKHHRTQRKTFYKTSGEPPKRHVAVESNISSRRDIGRSRFYTQSFLPCCIRLLRLDCGPTLSTEEVQEGQRRKGESDAFF